MLQVEALQEQVKAVEDFVDEWASKSIDTSNRVHQEHVGALKQAKGMNASIYFALSPRV